jgi:hypothetical protein
MEFNPTSVEEVQTKYSKGLKQPRFLMLNWRCDLEYMQAASRLGERCVAVLLAIMHRRNITRSDEVTLPTDYLSPWGISRTSKLRALHTLEKAGLISVERIPGRSALIRTAKQARKKARK